MTECKCRTCTKENGRTPTCKFDGTCSKYAEFRKLIDEANERKGKEREIMARLKAKAISRAKYLYRHKKNGDWR